MNTTPFATGAEETAGRLAELFDTAPVGYFMVARDGTIRRANLTAAAMLGGERAELAGRAIHAFVTPGALPVFDDFFDKLFVVNVRHSCEIELQAADGRRIVAWIESSVLAGSQECLLVVIDVTERKRAEQALWRSEERWRSTFEAIEDPICLIGLDRKIQKYNAAFARMVSLPAETVPGRLCCEVVHGTKKQLDACPFERMKRTGKGQGFEFAFGKRWFRETAHPLLDEKHRVCGAVHVFTDMTEAKQAHDAILRKNLALEEVLSQVSVEKERLKENVSANVQRIVLPVIEKLKAHTDQPGYRKLLEGTVEQLTSSFGRELSTSKAARLTPKESEICALIRAGMKNKEIARLQGTAVSTVETERKVIRRKLGLTNKDANLVAFLRKMG